MDLVRFREEIKDELEGDILPFWLALRDPEGGFYGEVTSDGAVLKDAPRGEILNARIIWTFAAAYKALGKQEYLSAALHARDWFVSNIIDKENGGVFWSVSADGTPIDTKKQLYSQAFAIYAFSELYKVTSDKADLEVAENLFNIIESRFADHDNGGYGEALARDFSPLEEHPAIGLRYVNRPEQLGHPDLVILPGTKNTLGDLRWLRETGLAGEILALHEAGCAILGVCGGYQMLGRSVSDPEKIEGGGSVEGLDLLPCETVFTGKKTRTRRQAVCDAGPFAGARLEGYEIHMGRTRSAAAPFCIMEDGTEDGAVAENVFGTYLHGLFDSGELVERVAGWLAERKGIRIPEQKTENRAAYRNRQYDLLADTVRSSLDMKTIEQAMEVFAHDQITGTD